MNFLDETIQALVENGKKEEDIAFVCSFPYITSWDDFKRNANFNYDNGFGWTEIRADLKIVGDNWYLRREEYDGSEWWEFESVPRSIDFPSTAAPHQIKEMILK